MLTPKTKTEKAPEKPAKVEAPKTEAQKAPDAKAEKPATPVEKEPLDIPEPKGMSPENLTNWKTWRDQAKKEINEARNEKAALAAKLKTYETATPADNEKTARLEARAKELEDKLAVFDLKSHPDFRKQYVEPKEKALSEAKMLLADNAVADAPDMTSLLSKPRAEFAKTVSELAAKLPAFDQGSLVASMREAYRLHGEEGGALSKAGELKQQLAAKAAAQARQAFEDGKTEFTTRIPEMAVPEGADADKIAEVNAYNTARQAALVEAERFTFGNASDREVAGIATRAASLNLVAHHVLPAMQRDLKRSNDLVAELSTELAAIKKGKSAPAFTGSKEAAAPSSQFTNYHDLAEKMLTRKSG